MLRDAKRVTCPRCGHSFVAFDMEDNATVAPMPVHCPRCGMEIKTGGLPGLLSRLLGLVRKSGAMVFVFISMTLFPSCKYYEDAHWDRMMAAREEVQQTDCVALLWELVEASHGNAAAVTRMTCLTPQMIQRLLDGTSKPTRLAELSVRAVAEDYYFYGKCFRLLDLCKDWKWRKPSCWRMNLPYVPDPFLNCPDPRAEILQENH